MAAIPVVMLVLLVLDPFQGMRRRMQGVLRFARGARGGWLPVLPVEAMRHWAEVSEWQAERVAWEEGCERSRARCWKEAASCCHQHAKKAAEGRSWPTKSVAPNLVVVEPLVALGRAALRVAAVEK